MTTSLADWKGAPAPTVTLLEGRFIRLEKLDPARHGDELFQALQGPGADPKLWDYLPYGPFPERSAFNDWLNNHASHSDPYFFCVVDRQTGQVQGLLSLMSIVPAQGRIEIGHVTFGAPMQRSPKSTEAVYLLAKYAFEQGYRRLEWKCNNANARSKYAAERLGFSFEGVFRQHMVVKGRNRDTAWYSIIDAEWSAIQAGFEEWLSEANQTGSGQVKGLADCRRQAR
ncbi:MULTISPECIES: GNAT family N-acetyltransferase [Pseudomonas]|jgi:RimJ/RimL family protein N-acetyltransferase|uniref:GNAT family N-acetyltransferase n=1 Tax=Pseudomonas extremorientalis TaxID=169669 RepID=A0A1H0SX85_9PSED|nr:MULTISPECIES: GNAT family protein [Pseudomonas]KAB0518065.1 GNAT family N-acetyltransferase [Pseudomonas extremorientalis]OIN06869.1 GNAT family N-acetyltransferase [Pseudomonas extremorientalis]QZP21260.1 GNAT family N-acetyltransferase [Pseudomonas sp. DR208]SDP46239.1 Protein N-acetyltransferase, RimJ/RimL family [Pseudomonas extremorientalis]